MGDWRIWVHGLAGAAINGGASTATVVIVDPGAFAGDMRKLLTVFAVGAVMGALLYLKQSPLPEVKTVTKESTTTTEVVTKESTPKE